MFRAVTNVCLLQYELSAYIDALLMYSSIRKAAYNYDVPNRVVPAYL